MNAADLLDQLNLHAKRVFELEADREREMRKAAAPFDQAIAEEKQKQLSLIQKIGGASAHANSTASAAPEMSLRMRAVQFVATNSPSQPNDLLFHLTSSGAADEKSAKQAIYDLTSVKMGLLERTPNGLILTENGKAALAKVLAPAMVG